MKKIQLILLMFILFSSGILAQTASKVKYLKPVNFQKKVTHVISGKSRSYYSLDSEEASVINVRGPGILRVMTRGRFVPGEDEKINYQIKYTVNGAEEISKSYKSVRRSSKSTYFKGTLGVPGQLRDFEIELGRGNHTIELKAAAGQMPVASRYRFTPTKAKKMDWIAFSPMVPSEPVDLITRESTSTYYRFSINKPLKIKIIGPTQLRVLTRIENHYHMKGRIHYRVQVKEDSRIVNTYQLSSRRSEITMYRENTELIPGKACEFVINVPKGKHIYEVTPLDKDKSTVLGRILFPEKDVSNEE